MNTDSETPIKTTSWLGIGAMLSAIGASICCVGPFLFLSLGMGGAWLSSLTAMEPVRPFFIILTLVFMVLGYRKLYWVPSCCEEKGGCVSALQAKQRLIFWLMSIFILLLLVFPWLIVFFLA